VLLQKNFIEDTAKPQWIKGAIGQRDTSRVILIFADRAL
jgi:hypothetical protein